MTQLRLESEESAAKVEELQAKVKALEQENLQKEQEIISLTHKNSVLESEVEKYETQVKDLKSAASEGAQHGTQNETLTRRLQLLEEEAEQADKTLREANEKYAASCLPLFGVMTNANLIYLTIGCDRPTSRPDTSSGKSRLSSRSAISGSPSTRRWPRSTPPSRRSWRTSKTRLATSKRRSSSLLLLGTGQVSSVASFLHKHARAVVLG